MDHQKRHSSPQASLRSGNTQPESDGDNDQYPSGDESPVGDDNANGDGPRKRQRRPLSVS
jgi:hypothetical protein